MRIASPSINTAYTPVVKPFSTGAMPLFSKKSFQFFSKDRPQFPDEQDIFVKVFSTNWPVIMLVGVILAQQIGCSKQTSHPQNKKDRTYLTEQTKPSDKAATTNHLNTQG